MNAQKVTRHAWRSALDPPTDKPAWLWGAENIKISNSERSSKFDPEQTPWWKAPMECAGDYDTRQVVVIAPTGSGKSTMAEVIIPYSFAENAGNFLYASQTDEDAKFWVETRLKYAMRSCPKIMSLWPEDRHKSRKLEIIFPHAAFIAGGANISNFQEKSVRWLYGDEVWSWKDDLIREFLARHHNRWNRKVFLVSQGGYGETAFEREWLKTDTAFFSWKCECGEEQPFEFEGIKFEYITDKDGQVDTEATSKTARMKCRSCEKEYKDTVQNRRALSASNMDNGSLGYISTNLTPQAAMRGFRVDSLAVWWIPWSDEVKEFIEASRLAKKGVTDRLRQWTQKRRSKFWGDDMADSEMIIERGGFTKYEFENGEKIENEIHRFATIDAGGDHYWMVIAAWTSDSKCRVLWEGYVPSDGRDEAQLLGICEKYNIKRSLTFMDIGYEDKGRIPDVCAKHGWTGIKGDGVKRHWTHKNPNGGSVEKIYSPIRRLSSKSGGIIKFIFIASNEIKDILSRMVKNGDQIELPDDLSKAFENHMKCERRVVERDSKTGQEKAQWIRPGGKANHLFDCMCYQIGAALALEVFDDSSI